MPMPPQTSYVYALGRIEPRFPRISAEKEFMQATGQIDTAGMTEHQTLVKVLSDPRNLYLARQLCWVMTVAGLETYIVVPRQPTDITLLIETLRSDPDPGAIDAVIGVRGPVAPPDMCNGLTLPVVIFDQLYPFDRQSLVSLLAVKKSGKGGEGLAATAHEVLHRILAVSAGSTDADRALNYLAIRYPGIYERTAECHARDMALTSMEGRLWRLSAARKIVEVVFTFTHRKNEFVEKHGCKVDVNDEFPFLVSPMAPYYDY
jgi:hypothetical protein